MTTDTPDVLPEMQAEARGYARGVRAAINELAHGPVGDGLLRERVAAISALIPDDDTPGAIAETTPVADIAARKAVTHDVR